MASTLRFGSLSPQQALYASAWGVPRIAARAVGRKHFGPLNGQADRRAAMVALIEQFTPDVLIETGTHRADTTIFLSGFGLPVYSVEAVYREFVIARVRLRRRRNVTLALGDSRSLLHFLTGPSVEPFRRPLAYLDAHWYSDLPLYDELRLLWNGWPESIAVVDDFMVPHDLGFGYDDYGPGKRIDLTYCAPPAEVSSFFPAGSSKSETGARRGTCYFGRGTVAEAALGELAMAGALRRAEAANIAPTAAL